MKYQTTQRNSGSRGSSRGRPVAINTSSHKKGSDQVTNLMVEEYYRTLGNRIKKGNKNQ